MVRQSPKELSTDTGARSRLFRKAARSEECSLQNSAFHGRQKIVNKWALLLRLVTSWHLPLDALGNIIHHVPDMVSRNCALVYAYKLVGIGVAHQADTSPVVRRCPTGHQQTAKMALL
jgi:hypothetical protein